MEPNSVGVPLRVPCSKANRLVTGTLIVVSAAVFAVMDAYIAIENAVRDAWHTN